MANIGNIIRKLTSADFVIYGNITNEQEYIQNVKFISGADENGNAIYKDTQDISWSQIQTEIPLEEFDNAMSNLRAKRNALLNETDYIVIKAKETGATIPTAWKTYRQALRDITQGLTTVEEVELVIFPEKP